jgi:hypothetical protein
MMVLDDEHAQNIELKHQTELKERERDKEHDRKKKREDIIFSYLSDDIQLL